MKKTFYKDLNRYILRSPIYSINKYRDFTLEKNISEENYKSLCKEPVYREAIFLSSPELLIEIDKWIQGILKDEKKIKRLKYTILKYFSRMTSRCTPFGLYSGCSVGEFSDVTNILLGDIKNFKKATRLDMHFLIELAQEISKIEFIKSQLKYFSNNSLYLLGNQLRYVEYKYDNNKRHHFTVAVDINEYLNEIVKKSENGILYSDLVNFLVSLEIPIEYATNFINELISSQFIISELEPSLTGQDFLNHVIKVLEKLNGTKNLLLLLKTIRKLINDLDKEIGNDINKFYQIIEEIQKLKVSYDLKYIFQTDLFNKTIQSSLNKELLKKIKKGIILLNKITLPDPENNLTKFIDAFYERYENKEVPLATALDIEIGLGYLQNHNSGDINPLVDDIIFSDKINKNTHYKLRWGLINKILLKKVNESLSQKKYKIQLCDEDFEELDINWDDLHHTICCIAEVLKVNGQEMLYVKNFAGSSASNLISRFGFGDENIKKLSQEIINKEQLLEERIIAEIVHLPESRTGNILLRPNSRKYEIPYLSKSQKPYEEQIKIDDLMISVTNSRGIKLRSKRLNKEIKPILTNAHNFRYNSLPIYQFLCDLQHQNKRVGIGFHFFPNQNDYEFLPRVEYEGLIIHKATWNLSNSHLKSLIDAQETETFEDELDIFKKKLMIPKYVVLVEGDNTLLINFENIDSVKMLLSIVRNRNSFQLEEFLFSDDEIVKNNENEYFTNQIIIPFYKVQNK
ncbi:MAG: lantibiotic dehydratase [bacterium]|nr:lantibiotic dehydratase [bacterium]